MVKLVYCVRRRSEVPPAAFRKYWLENHGPFVRELAKALNARRYVQSHTLDTELNAVVRIPRGSKEPYDGITELWWDRIEDLVQILNSPEAQQAHQKLIQDEANFVDLANSSLFFTDEHTIFG